jgi:hypothetical protein
MKTIHQGLRSLLLATSCLIVGCAAPRGPDATAAPPASAPEMPASTESVGSLDEGEPATLAEAEELLEKARADLDRLALNEPQPRMSAGAPAPAAAPPAPAPEESKKRSEKSAEAADRASAERESPDACETACKAFSSLARASDAVCRLDAEGGGRCQRARQIREDASRRVASCGCAK